jgi:preprotein translocase subunit SecA
MEDFIAEWFSIFGETFTLSTDKEVMYVRAMDVAHSAYRKKMDKYALLSELRDMERYVILQAIDMCWVRHLVYLDHLRNGIQFYAYGQQNPVTVYKDKSYDGFEVLLSTIVFNAVCLFFSIQPGEHGEVYKSSNLSRTPAEMLQIDSLNRFDSENEELEQVNEDQQDEVVDDPGENGEKCSEQI